MRQPAFLALALIATAAASAAEPPTRFGITLAGFRVGWLTLRSERADARYTASAHFETAGLAGLLDYTFDGEASGALGDGKAAAPDRFSAMSHSPRALRKTSIEWTGGVPTTVSVIPPRAENVDPAGEAGALDPVTALVRLFRQRSEDGVCGTEFRIFDGSRSVRLTLDQPVASGDAITCEGDYVREAGEPFTPIDPIECPFRAIYRRGADGTATLDEIRIPTRFGQAVVARTA